MSTTVQLALVALLAAAAGAVNSIAGGGTLLTFPALVALGVPPLAANATSTVALWPAALGSMWGYRRELVGARTWALRFAAPSLAGGLAGALLLLRTPEDRFARLVPWLVLGATLLFMLQGSLARATQRRARRPLPGAADAFRDSPPGIPSSDAAPGDEPLLPPPLSFLVAQGLIGVYGGYFGAGIGILMLATLGLMGLRNIHRMNGLKNWGGLCINAVAVVTFALSGLVDWPVALTMAAGSTVGGYLMAGAAQRVPQARVRQAIVVIGLTSTIWLAARGGV